MKYESRRYVILMIFVSVGVIFMLRLFSMQVISNKWEERAQVISEKKVYIYPPRGVIYDRNGVKLVDNVVFYDLMVIPEETTEMDTAEFCRILGIDRAFYDAQMAAAVKHSKRVPSIFLKEITGNEFDLINENLYQFPGYFLSERTLRVYPRGIAAQALGYLSEVDSGDMKRDRYYRIGDYIGKTGIERSYEAELRGKKGVRYLLQNAVGLESGSYEGGKYDTLPVKGKNLYCTIDADLQAYGEFLMKNKIGSIVAIEPATGEVLAMVSAPTFDPNLLVGRKSRAEHFPRIMNDKVGKPLFNKAIRSKYPPGSIFKMYQALIGMQDGVLTPQTTFVCDGSKVADHVFGTIAMYDAIKSSSNMWFYHAMYRIVQPGKHRNFFKDAHEGLDNWAKHMRSYGLGQVLPIELESMEAGRIPDANYYDNEFPTPQNPYGKYRWAYTTIYSNSIGQGEVELTPLHMANLGAIVANRGYFYYPHLVKKVGDDGDKRPEFKEKHYVYPKAEHFPIVIDAMRAVVEEPGGTASRARIPGIVVCGKTGTAQNPHGEDHSVFIAFAPMDNPKIAIAVYVENAKWGGEWAAPIASLMIEKYLTGKIADPKKEERIVNEDFLTPLYEEAERKLAAAAAD
jgi:penicillin-binding protein 2